MACQFRWHMGLMYITLLPGTHFPVWERNYHDGLSSTLLREVGEHATTRRGSRQCVSVAPVAWSFEEQVLFRLSPALAAASSASPREL